MKSLVDYIKESFTVGGTTSSKIILFDVDDTLIKSKASVSVYKDGKIVRKLNSEEYNDDILGPGETYDYTEFDSAKGLRGAKFTRYWDTLKREYRRGTHIGILTARGNGKILKQFFLKNGIDIKDALIIAVGGNSQYSGNIQQRKAQAIEHLYDLGYRTFIFFDDNEDNLKQAKSLEDKLDIKIHTNQV